MDAIQAKSENKEARLFVAGDTHGSVDAGMLDARNFPEGCGLTKDDYIVIAGDLGLLWLQPV